jgi:hypothetical protein
MTAFGWTRTDADEPTYDLGADSSYFVEQWGLGSWAAYHGDVRIGEPGTYGTSDEAKIAAETAYVTETFLTDFEGWDRLTEPEREQAATVLLADWAEFGQGSELREYADTEWWLTFLADVLNVSIPDLDTWRAGV